MITDYQIEAISERIRHSGVRQNSIKAELLDHICCAVEYAMDQGLSFSEALDLAIEDFGQDGLKRVEQRSAYLSPGHISLRRVAASALLAITFTLACFPLTDYEQQLVQITVEDNNGAPDLREDSIVKTDTSYKRGLPDRPSHKVHEQDSLALLRALHKQIHFQPSADSERIAFEDSALFSNPW